MKNYKRKLNDAQIAEIRRWHENGIAYSRIAKEFNVRPCTIAYHCNENTKKKTLERNVKNTRLKSLDKNGKKYKQHLVYMSSYSGKKSIAKSWIRNYLRTGKLKIEDVEDVLNEFRGEK